MFRELPTVSPGNSAGPKFTRSLFICVTYENRAYSMLANAGEAMKAPNKRNRRSQIVGFIRGAVVILIEVRVLIAELMFTAAALYGCYVAYQVFIHRLL
jgi:hypothetical protein